ncbi:hypothetical protein ALQ84_200275 [Pseudomonas caricapapayae]|uniref:Uncharacterized protein n=1 Tax=Pseudomonas caricapapayae TaxID=46678 RepID=A0A3M3AXD8_9PSED|nr:hypothetical protein ALQ84_200275 [Pseudomonas caricapapayae]
MDDPEGVAAGVMNVKTVEFLLLHQQPGTVNAGVGDLEGLAAAQREHARDGVILGELQVPAKAVAGVPGIERAEGQGDGHERAGQVIGLELWQADRGGVQPGTRIDPAAEETHEVEGVRVQ